MQDKKIISRVLEDNSEVIDYDSSGIPLYIKTECLSYYLDMRSTAHWHDDLEIMYIIHGELIYHVNKQNLHLSTNDCVIVNSRQIHFSSSYRHRECTFTCIVFHPQLFSGNAQLYESLFLPIIKNPSFEYVHVKASHPLHDKLSKLVFGIMTNKAEKNIGYEVKIIGALYTFWGTFAELSGYLTMSCGAARDADMAAQKDMVSFIHQCYMQDLTLNDIASAGHVGRNKCCLLFKEYLHQSPIEFLIQYRLEKGCLLLKKTDSSITEISEKCGFNNVSYFCQKFKSRYGCSPRIYRKTAEN
ncbi:MAG TPA: AraC family transcriptional regulator [Lachnospiraceae bacterium]|nr:AraC family transcriptional regulator [Lachnospiraceae bacterium]